MGQGNHLGPRRRAGSMENQRDIVRSSKTKLGWGWQFFTLAGKNARIGFCRRRQFNDDDGMFLSDCDGGGVRRRRDNQRLDTEIREVEFKFVGPARRVERSEGSGRG